MRLFTRQYVDGREERGRTRVSDGPNSDVGVVEERRDGFGELRINERQADGRVLDTDLDGIRT